MTDTMANLGDEAKGALFDALDLAMGHAEDIADGFTPFFIAVAANGEQELTVCIEDVENFTGSLEHARKRVRSIDPSTRCVALAWDGYLTVDDDRTEAVFVEAYELGKPKGVLFAQRYARGEDGFRPIGDPLKVNHEPEPLVPPATDRRAAAIARIQQLRDQSKQQPR
jgi:hypothetical protein